MVKMSTLFALSSALLASAVSAHDAHEAHKCTHDDMDHPEPQIMEGVEDADLQIDGRTLQDYPQMRFKANTDAIWDQSQAFQDYINKDVLPPVLAYFTAALKVKRPLLSPLKFSSTTSTICGIGTPAEVKAGLPIDFYYMIDASTDTSSTWVADSYACFLTSNTKRPYVARTVINTAQFPVAQYNVLLNEKNIVCIMHELTHNLGFSGSLYKYYLDANGNTMSGHGLNANLDGMNAFVLNVEPLTTRLRNFFGCSTLIGAYMEADGGEGTAKSHFERRHFGMEYMTSGLIYQMQVSEFTLALLEGSGWYVPDYSMADTYTFGQGQGCNFLTGSCIAYSADEWCSGSTRGCTSTGRGGGACAADIRSNGCRYQHPRLEYDCENDGSINYSRLPGVEAFGRYNGGKCFMGTLTTGSSPSSTSFCLKATCEGSGTSTTVKINLGSTQATCTKEGSITVAGYNGVLNCPDPIAYCATIGAKKCPRGCSGRGTCVDGKCVCDGDQQFLGTDCGLRWGYGI